VKSGIIIPDTAKEKRWREGDRGRRRQAGRQREADPAGGEGREPGALREVRGTEIKIDDEEHVILREDEILGIIE